MHEIDFTFRAGEAKLIPLYIESDVVIDQANSTVTFRLATVQRPDVILIDRICTWDGVNADNEAACFVTLLEADTETLCPSIYKMEFRYEDPSGANESAYTGYFQVLPSLF